MTSTPNDYRNENGMLWFYVMDCLSFNRWSCITITLWFGVDIGILSIDKIGKHFYYNLVLFSSVVVNKWNIVPINFLSSILEV